MNKIVIGALIVFATSCVCIVFQNKKEARESKRAVGKINAIIGEIQACRKLIDKKCEKATKRLLLVEERVGKIESLLNPDPKHVEAYTYEYEY